MRRHLRQGHVNQHDKTSEGQKQVFKIFNSRFFLIYSFNVFNKFISKGSPLAPSIGSPCPQNRWWFPRLQPLLLCLFVYPLVPLFIRSFAPSFVLFRSILRRSSLCSFGRSFVFPSMDPHHFPANSPPLAQSKTRKEKTKAMTNTD